MKLWRVRRSAYRVGKILGDVQAVRRGPTAIVKRVERRFLWRFLGRFVNAMTR